MKKYIILIASVVVLFFLIQSVRSEKGANIVLNKKVEPLTAYLIERASSPQSLEKQVNKSMQNGWAPMGGMSSEGGLYFQAMVR
jgi:hypothetical protein